MIDSFVDYLSYERKYSPNTIVAYQNDLIAFRDFVQTKYDEDELSQVAYPQIRNWIASLVSQGIANRSINRKVSSLKTFYKYLQKTEQINKNPLANHKALKVQKKVQVPFSVDEVAKAIEMADEENLFLVLRNRLLVELFYTTGIRRAELISIRLSAIDFSGKTLKVLGKRNKERYVPLLPSTLNLLEHYLEEKNKFAASSPYVFVTEKGNKIYETLVYRIINNYFSKVSSKVKKSPHILRHTFATHLLNEGADLNSVKELLGHSSLASTQVYTHNSLESIKKVYNQAHPRSNKKQ